MFDFGSAMPLRLQVYKLRPNHIGARRFLAILAELEPGLHRNDASEALKDFFDKYPQLKIKKNQKSDLLTEYFGRACDQGNKPIRWLKDDDWSLHIVDTTAGRMAWNDVPVQSGSIRNQKIKKTKKDAMKTKADNTHVMEIKVGEATKDVAVVAPAAHSEPDVLLFDAFMCQIHCIPFYIPVVGGEAVWELPAAGRVR